MKNKRKMYLQNYYCLAIIISCLLPSVSAATAKNGSTQQTTLTGEMIQQTKRVTGSVVDKEGMPMIGVNMQEKGTLNGVITDFEKYELNPNFNLINEACNFNN